MVYYTVMDNEIISQVTWQQLIVQNLIHGAIGNFKHPPCVCYLRSPPRRNKLLFFSFLFFLFHSDAFSAQAPAKSTHAFLCSSLPLPPLFLFEVFYPKCHTQVIPLNFGSPKRFICRLLLPLMVESSSCTVNFCLVHHLVQY